MVSVGLSVVPKARSEVLTAFERLYTEGQATPPTTGEGWQTVELKDVWRLRRRARHREAWYRATFVLPKRPDEEYGIYVPRVSAAASFWVNGVEVGRAGLFKRPVERSWNQPLLLSLPSALLRAGDNRLDIRLGVLVEQVGFLYEVHVAPMAELRPLYIASHFAKITLTEIATGIMSVGVLVILTFYVFTRLPRSYLWFALGMLCWCLYSLELVVQETPLPTRLWLNLTGAALMLAMWFFFKTVHRVLGLTRRRTEWAIGVWAVLSIAAGFLGTPKLVGFISGLSVVLTMLALWVLGAELCYYGWRDRGEGWIWTVLTGLSMLVLVGMDATAAALETTTLFAKFPYVPLLAMVFGGTGFVIRVIGITRDSESFEQRTASAMQAAVGDERRRLMREIHDGVGGQLVSTLAQLENSGGEDEKLIESLRSSLDDLRLIVHSLETMSQQGDIVTILATLRERMERSLLRQGIRFDWQVSSLPRIEDFGSEQALHFMRIVQEAITNTVKHADADTIAIHCDEQQRDGRAGVLIVIADNGKGFARREAGAGLGLENMAERAGMLGARLRIDSGGDGTRVSLWIPVSADEGSAPAADGPRGPAR